MCVVFMKVFHWALVGDHHRMGAVHKLEKEENFPNVNETLRSISMRIHTLHIVCVFAHRLKWERERKTEIFINKSECIIEEKKM